VFEGALQVKTTKTDDNAVPETNDR
jgi:hypothetical protein